MKKNRYIALNIVLVAYAVALIIISFLPIWFKEYSRPSIPDGVDHYRVYFSIFSEVHKSNAYQYPYVYFYWIDLASLFCIVIFSVIPIRLSQRNSLIIKLSSLFLSLVLSVLIVVAVIFS